MSELRNTYLKYWSSIPIILVMGYLLNETLDIAVHDTYFVVERFQIGVLISAFLFVSGLGYFILKSKMNCKLTKAHGWLTTIGAIIIAVSTGVIIHIQAQPPSEIEYAHIEWITQLITGQIAGSVIIALGFIVYMLNIGLTLFNY